MQRNIALLSLFRSAMQQILKLGKDVSIICSLATADSIFCKIKTDLAGNPLHSLLASVAREVRPGQKALVKPWLEAWPL